MSASTSQGRHPAALWEGFWGIQLLHAGQSLGLFEALNQPMTPAELAQKLSLEIRYTEFWCSAAEACGLLEQEQTRFVVPEGLSGWLADSKGFTQSHLHLSHRLNETFQAVFAGRALPEPPISLRLILAENLLQNYRWAFEQVPGQVPAFAHALQQGTRALEVGCGLGLGLGVLRSNYSHLELYGLEADYECAREAERATRAVIHVGELPGDRFGKTFDLVVCFRALAGAASPEDLLSECARLLSPQGWLLLGTEVQDRAGDRKSSARSLGELFAYQLLAGERDVNFFTRERLKDLLHRLGLKVEAEVEAPDWGTPLYLCTSQGNSQTA
jgi:SAM-dependent methyltransferase